MPWKTMSFPEFLTLWLKRFIMAESFFT